MTKFTYKNGDKEEILYKHLENRLLLCPKATLAENKATIKVGFSNIEIPISEKIEKQPIISERGVCPKCGKKHIDLREKIKWQTQFDSQWGIQKLKA